MTRFDDETGGTSHRQRSALARRSRSNFKEERESDNAQGGYGAAKREAKEVNEALQLHR